MSAPAEPFVAGSTALVVAVPEAEPVVGELRRSLDSSARFGVPAHVTVLFPFLPAAAIDDAVLDALREVVGSCPAFDASFTGCGRFPGVLYLVPEPAAPWRELTGAVWSRWPEAPPYGGAFEEVLPHLTVADGQAPDVLEAAEAVVTARLPVRTAVAEVLLLEFDGEAWRRRASFSLGGGDAAGRQARPPRGL
ncbi:2'-5' RNA ligase family protein [Isoptericola hypogeus]|uniref:2'-5' RNA ligase family protein n=1 Tax=Isoptericola hypogeus TaxID=300179 RepID=A0ABN2IZL5_9MICO